MKKESENQILPYCLSTLIYFLGCVAGEKKKKVSLITKHLTFEEYKRSVSSCCLSWASYSYSVFSFSMILEEGQSSGNQSKTDIKLLTKSQLLPPLDISGSGRKETFNK